MTLLKAIFTGRRRSRITILLLLFVSTQLSAVTFNVRADFSNLDSALYTEIKDAFEFISDKVENEDLFSQALGREKENLERDYLVNLSSKVKKEQDVSTLKKGEADESSFSISFLDIVLSNEEKALLVEGNKNILSYVEQKNDADMIVFSLVDGDEVAIYAGCEEKAFFIYSPSFDYTESILRTLLSLFFSPDFSLLSFSSERQFTCLSHELFDSYAIVRKGENRFLFSSPYSEDLEIAVNVSTPYLIIPLVFEERETFPLSISSIPYAGSMYYMGEKVGSYIESVYLPYSIFISEDGYISRSYQNDEKSSFVEVSLLDEKLYNEGKTEEKKQEFYSNLIATLALFGLSVASDVVNNIYSLSFDAASTFTAGISIVQLIRTIDTLFEYRDSVYRGF